MTERGTWRGVTGRRVIVTGATRGIGLAAAETLADAGARLTLVARSSTRGEAAATRLRARRPGAEVEVLEADLESQAGVRRVAAEILSRHRRIDVLVNNAGAMFARRELTEDGVERTWALNHLAPFLLTALLSERLRESAPARVITTSSDAHKGAAIPFDDITAERSYGLRGFRRYAETKLANILFTKELSRRMEGTGVTAACFHPGTVSTGFNRNNGPLMTFSMLVLKPFSRSPGQGADTLVWLARSEEMSQRSGDYYADRRSVRPSQAALDPVAARRLWELSEAETGIPPAG